MSPKRKKVRARLTYGDNGWGWTFPHTAEAYDQIEAQIARAITDPDEPMSLWVVRRARAALRAIGIVRPKENKS